MKTQFLFCLALLIGITLATASAQNVYVNSSPNANFSSYHTYAWGQNPNPNQIANSFLAQEAQNQINTQLQSRGLKMVQENQTPDLIVVMSSGMKTQTSYNAWGMRGIGEGRGGITPEQSVIGTLIDGKDGIVYQKDLGEQIADAASALAEYNPGDDWKPAA